MPVADRLVCFSHGKESGPWGAKIRHLAETAYRMGWQVASLDYRGIDDADRRVAHLVAHCPRAQRLVLAGSSMGGYVAAQACAALEPIGLFLIAPALYFDGYAREPEAIPAHCRVVHGWRDEVVPPERAIRFASTHRAHLRVLDGDHRLLDRLDELADEFRGLLAEADAAA